MPQHQKQPQIITLKVDNKNFELLAIQDKVFEYRKNQGMSLDNVLYTESIYSDAKEGKEVSAKDLHILGDDPIKRILLEGHAELSTEERRKMVEEKTEEIIGYLHANFVDLEKKAIPHDRVKLAIDQLKGLSIDPYENVENEAEDLIKKLEKAGLLYFESAGVEAEISVPYKNLSKLQQLLKKNEATSDDENYIDGGVSIKFMISPGMFDILMAELEKELKGDFEMKVLGQEGNNQQVETESSAKESKKGAKKNVKK